MSKKRSLAGEIILFNVFVVLISASSATAQEERLQGLNVAYTSATPTRAALWIGKETGLFEKHGLEGTSVSAIRLERAARDQSSLADGGRGRIRSRMDDPYRIWPYLLYQHGIDQGKKRNASLNR